MFKLKKSQRNVNKHITDFINGNEQTLLLEGEGGSGKTFVVTFNTINTLLQSSNKFNFFFLALTNDAKNVLEYKFNELCNNLKVNEINKPIFSTIHKFFKSKKKYNNVGEQQFEIIFNECTLIKDKYIDGPKQNILYVDECSMVNYEHYEYFMKLIKKYSNVKVIFLGDSNQLSYIKNENMILMKRIGCILETKKINNNKIFNRIYGFLEYTNNISPPFYYIKNYIKLKGNQRINNKKIKNIIDIHKKKVRKSKLRIKLGDFKNDSFILTTRMELINRYIKELFILNEQSSSIILCYTRKFKKNTNNIIRKMLFGDNVHFNKYKFMNGETIVVKNTFSVLDKCMETVGDNIIAKTIMKILNITFDNIEDAQIFKGLFTFNFKVQHIYTDYCDHIFKRVCNEDQEKLDYIYETLRSLIIDYNLSRNNKKMTLPKDTCKLCSEYNDEFYITNNGTNSYKICTKCHEKIKNYIKVNDTRKFKNFRYNAKLSNELFAELDDFKSLYDPPFDFHYVKTIHESQGCSYDNVVVAECDISPHDRNKFLTSRLRYVAYSRARQKIFCITRY
jgi:hypothetical protein